MKPPFFLSLSRLPPPIADVGFERHFPVQLPIKATTTIRLHRFVAEDTEHVIAATGHEVTRLVKSDGVDHIVVLDGLPDDLEIRMLSHGPYIR